MSETDPFLSEEGDGADERTRLEAYFMQSLEVDLLLRVCPDEEDKQERSSVLSQLKAKCDMPECNSTKCRKGRNDHAI